MVKFLNKNSKSVIRKLLNMCECDNRLFSTQNTIKEIFLKSVKAVQPHTLMTESVKLTGRHLVVNSKSYLIERPCYVVGFGKAVLGMAVQLERILDDKLQRGLISVPTGIFKCFEGNKSILPDKNSKLLFMEGATDNIPDENAMKTAVQIKQMVEALDKDDLLIVLISGGGSALLPLPKEGVTLEEKQNLIRNLSKKGADIVELNCVRKQISCLKGGGLGELSYPAKVISLVLSDIIDDPLDFIASGPTTPNTDNPKDAIDIIKKYGIYETVPLSIKTILEQENRFPISTIPIIHGKYEHVDNYIVGNNQLAVDSAKKFAASLGFQTAIISTKISGNTGKLSVLYAKIAHEMSLLITEPSNKYTIKQFLESLKAEIELSNSLIEDIMKMDFSKPICLIGAGEPTVLVRGNGKGGRNQQLALEFSLEVNKLNVQSADISFLSCGTDGIDGPTDAAGAIGTLYLVQDSLKQNIKPEDYLLNNDSYNFFIQYNNGENLVKTGHTGTNVMDIHVMLITPKTV